MALSKEVDNVINTLVCNGPYAKPTISRKQLKELLLYSDGWLIAAGRMCDIKSKHLGAGVYAVWLERKNP